MAATSIIPAAFTISSAVTYSGLSRSRLYDLMKQGEIASFQVGGRRMILRETLDGFFARLSAAA